MKATQALIEDSIDSLADTIGELSFDIEQMQMEGAWPEAIAETKEALVAAQAMRSALLRKYRGDQS